MRVHLVSIAVLVLFGVGVKMISSAVMIAEGALRSRASASVDVHRMHQNTPYLPVETFHDMTFVFPMAVDRTI